MDPIVLLVFLLALLGSKLAIALVFIYCLFPGDGRCPACDEATIPLQSAPGLGLAARALRLEHRWCPRCDDTMLARRRPGLRIRVETRARPERERIG